MRKKNPIFVILLFILFIYSCSDNQLTETIQDTNTIPEAIKPPTSSIDMVIPVIKSASYEIGPYGGLGYGYDVTGEYANALSSRHQVVNITEFIKNEPGRFNNDRVLSASFSAMEAKNASEFSELLSQNLEATRGKNMFRETLSSNFSNTMTNNNKFEAKYIYAKATHEIIFSRFNVNADANQLINYLTPEFLQSLNSKTPQQIVEEYGTHVMLDIYIGAKLEALYQAETTDPDRQQAAYAGIDLAMKTIFSSLPLSHNYPQPAKNFNQRLSFRSIGGDPSKSLNGYLNLDKSNPKFSIYDWQNTVNLSNSYLVDFSKYSLIYIYDFVSNPTKKAALKAYVDQYLIDNKVTLN